MVGTPELITVGVMLLAIIGEWFHSTRVSKIRHLLFGPAGKGAWWTPLAPVIRILAITLATWGFCSLLLVVQARVHNLQEIPENDFKHMVLVVDVSPSMHLSDAGPEGSRSRRQRASDILESLFNRIPMRQFKISVIGVYTDAKPLLKDSKDHEVVRHIMEKMPMFHAFKPGKTKLMDGIKLAAEMVDDWNPKSTYVLVLTDGDTVPDTGMPTMPASVVDTVIVGIGDPTTGKFIDGHQSRQDVTTLRSVANRLRGTYHNGNQKHLTSQIVSKFVERQEDDDKNDWTRREWSIAAIILGSSLFSLLPLMLHYLGTGYRPGTKILPSQT
ncbi:MAG: VWA domain-containing protein [Planctomycetota bacterium]